LGTPWFSREPENRATDTVTRKVFNHEDIFPGIKVLMRKEGLDGVGFSFSFRFRSIQE
jgi:hypothetical protein